MVTHTPKAFLLLTLNNVSVHVADATYSGVLSLECVTAPPRLPVATPPPPRYSGILGGYRSAKVITPEPAPLLNDRDVYLVLKIENYETLIDPAKVVIREDGPGWRTYRFQPNEVDPNETLIRVWPPLPGERNPQLVEDLETFDGILGQYVSVRNSASTTPQNVYASVNEKSPGATTQIPPPPPPPSYPYPQPYTQTSAQINPSIARAGSYNGDQDLRGHVVMINEDTGEVLGQLDHQVRIHEDAGLRTDQNGAVILEIPETRTGREQDATAMEMFVRAIPPDQQDWITKSATIASHAISGTTSLLLATVTTASNHYINNSQPSPHHSNNHVANNTNSGLPESTATPSSQPPRVLTYLTSEKMRKNLSTVHSVSGKAVVVSEKTASMVDSMIRRAVGSKPKPAPNTLTQYAPPIAPNSGPSHYNGGNPPYQGHPPGAYPSHQPYPPKGSGGYPSNQEYYNPSAYPTPQYQPAIDNGKLGPPPLPSRSLSPSPSIPPRSGAPSPVPSGPQVVQQAQKLSTKTKLMFSLDLVLSTIDNSTIRLMNGGTETAGNIANHKYGSEAAETVRTLAGTARNVGLVYIDLSGMGRKAILKRAGKQYIKGKVSSGNTQHLHQYQPPLQHQPQPPQQQQGKYGYGYDAGNGRDY